MAGNTPEGGTLIIAALLVLALGFAGYWIIEYAQTGGPPSGLFPWFGAVALAIIVIGLGAVLLRGGTRR